METGLIWNAPVSMLSTNGRLRRRKQPYAIARKDQSPFGIAGIWENRKDPRGEWVRTFGAGLGPRRVSAISGV